MAKNYKELEKKCAELDRENLTLMKGDASAKYQHLSNLKS